MMFQTNDIRSIYVFSAAVLFTHAVTTNTLVTRSYEVLEGDNFLVICNTTESPDIDIYWTKNDTKSTFRQEGKRLQILNINRTYSGDYICHAFNTSYPEPEYNETGVNMTVDVINIDVQYPAEVDTFHIEPYTMMENETFNVTFDMQGHPNPTWSIRNRDTGDQLASGNGTASGMIGPNKAICQYMGYWECTGSNKLNKGVNASRGHYITIYCSPRPKYGKNNFVVRGAVGKYVILYMYLQAYPRANYTWSKDDGKDISTSAKQDDYASETILTFPLLTVPYFGNYTLKMQNEYGIYYAQYQIIANGEPETPTNVKFSNVTHNSVTLQWTSGFDMGSKQHFYVMKLFESGFSQLSPRIPDNSTNHGINQNWTYVQTGLISDTSYKLAIDSQNDMGFSSSFSKSINFRTKEYPGDDSASSSTTLIVGLTFGTLGTLGMLAFMVYAIKFRQFRTSYNSMNGRRA